jgi:hypothetical protein
MGRAQAALRRLLVHMPIEHSQTPIIALTDASLCEALTALASTTGMTRSAIYTAHSLIRAALMGQCSDGRSRWPIFWTKGRCCRWVTGREVCLANTLPWGMLRCSDAPALRALFERAAHRILTHYGGIRRPSTGRKVFAFLWGFLIHPTVALAAPLDAGTSIHTVLGDRPVSWIASGLHFERWNQHRGPACTRTPGTGPPVDGPFSWSHSRGTSVGCRCSSTPVCVCWIGHSHRVILASRCVPATVRTGRGDGRWTQIRSRLPPDGSRSMHSPTWDPRRIHQRCGNGCDRV